MNKDYEMQFRYDNAKHHRDIKTFPHHKHTKNEIIESKEIEIQIALAEIEKILTINA